MNKKKIPTWLGISIIIIIAVTVGMFLWMYEKEKDQNVSQKQNIVSVKNQSQQINKKQQSNNNLQQNVTEGLTTNKYTNKTYGFEFEYPKNLLVTSRSTDNNIVISYSDEGHWDYSINISVNASNLSLEQAFDQELKKPQYNNKNIIKSDIVLNNIPAKRFLITDRHDYGNAGVVMIVKNNIIIIYGDDSIPDMKSNFESFINTFKFAR